MPQLAAAGVEPHPLQTDQTRDHPTYPHCLRDVRRKKPDSPKYNTVTYQVALKDATPQDPGTDTRPTYGQ